MRSVKREASSVDEGSRVKKVKQEAVLEVKVQLKCFDSEHEDDYGEDDPDNEDDYEHDDVDNEADDTFVDASTENSDFFLDMLGSPSCEFDCTREGRARIMVNGVKVGKIQYTLIDRTMLGDGDGLDFHEACDAESAELEGIAAYFFKPNSSGLLNRKFLNRMVDNSSYAKVNHGCFMYISSFLLDAPYDRACSAENSIVATTAIEQLIHSPNLRINDIDVTLIMYIPEGWVDPLLRGQYSDELMRKDKRSFERAGFQTINGGGSEYLFFEMP